MLQIATDFVHDGSSTLDSHRFVSTSHPGTLPWQVVYGRALVRPLAACMLPVMIITLVAVLEGVQILPGAFWAAAGALFVASTWTTFRIQSEVAEIRIGVDLVAVRTVWEILNNVDPQWEHILDVRDYGRWMHVTIGLGSYELDRKRWPQYDDLARVLRRRSRQGH